MTKKNCAIGAFVATALIGIVGVGAAQGRDLGPGKIFQDCPQCPEMVVVPTGSVKAGDPKDYDRADDPDRPSITIAKPFAIGRFEVTQAQWETVMGSNPSRNKGASLPVEKVRHVDVMEFIAKLNAKTGKQYRLPSEAEWEYAARAGSNATYSFGDNIADLGQYAWFKDNANELTQPVGKLKPNAFGLYDMHGNVWEWTSDCNTSTYASVLPDSSAKQMTSYCYKVIRGGSVFNFPKYLSAFHKAGLTQVNSDANLGFRLALTLP
jgi:formylglycine-generating enzyme required for sulfatase activity